MVFQQSRRQRIERRGAFGALEAFAHSTDAQQDASAAVVKNGTLRIQVQTLIQNLQCVRRGSGRPRPVESTDVEVFSKARIESSRSSDVTPCAPGHIAGFGCGNRMDTAELGIGQLGPPRSKA